MSLSLPYESFVRAGVDPRPAVHMHVWRREADGKRRCECGADPYKNRHEILWNKRHVELRLAQYNSGPKTAPRLWIVSMDNTMPHVLHARVHKIPDADAYWIYAFNTFARSSAVYERESDADLSLDKKVYDLMANDWAFMD